MKFTGTRKGRAQGWLKLYKNKALLTKCLGRENQEEVGMRRVEL